MRIACPSCTTTYVVERSSLGARGRPVRCVRCRTVWFVNAPADDGTSMAALAAEAATGWSRLPREAPHPEPEPPPPPSRRAEADAPATVPAPAPLPALPAAPTALAPLAEAPPLVPDPATPSAALPAPSAEPDVIEIEVKEGPDIEALAARRWQAKQVQRKRQKRGSRKLPLVLLCLGGAVAALIGFRANIVRIAPQAASLYAAIGMPVNLRGLAFTNLKAATEVSDGVTVLLLEGSIVNTLDKPLDVPRLRFSVRNANGSELYSWTALPDRSILGGKEEQPFRTRLASPPADARDVLVRFFGRQDKLATAH